MNDARTPVPIPGTRRPRGRHGLPPAFLALSVVVTILFILFILLIAYELIYRDRVILGVSIAGQPMSGLTRLETKQFLREKFGEPDAILARYDGEAVVVRADNQTWRAYPWELGLRTDFDPVADGAFALGHRSSWWDSLSDQVHCFWFGCDLGMEVQFDEQTALAYLSWLAPQVERLARDASVRIEGVRVVTTPAQNGRELDGATVIEQMRRRVLNNERGDLVMAFREKAPLISDANAATAKAQAERILAAPMMLTFSGRAWAIDQATLAAMIKIQPQQDSDGALQLVTSLDHARVVAYLKTLAHEINQPPRDARFRFDPNTGALTPILTSQYGQSLDPEVAAKQIEQQLLTGRSDVVGLASPAETSNVHTIALPVTLTKPTTAMEDAPKFGIKELVSQGASNFKGSSAGRLQNIRTSTAQFDGIIIPPGGVFSFNQYLGDVVEANGYDDAYIIFADRTILGPGGGVCQVSSTMFRAAFFGGFPIVERWAHAYRVSWYEPPVGLDATIFSPSVDLKFRNDTETYLLIQSKVDLKAATLTFSLYGTKPNRTVEMEEPIVENIVKPGPPVYTEDPTLKKGVTKQVEYAHDGADVTIWRKISVNGQVVKRDKFFSRYEPWVARYQVGTKVVK